MSEFFGNNSGFTIPKQASGDDSIDRSYIWSTAKVDKLLSDYADGLIDIRSVKNSPFFHRDISYRGSKIAFEYTADEIRELQKTADDVIYFATHHVKIKDEEGRILKIEKLRDYQYEIIQTFRDSKQTILMASRQIGKTITSAIFIVHYMLFNKDKNVMIVADNSITANEIIDKVRSIVENLPFYMKPGMVTNNVRSLKFDNNCRLIGRTTTKKTGIGFSIDLLYMDEFAHINEGYLNFFYRSIYPTISGIKNSKIIITSTPNGTNKFYELWIGALDGKNNYIPLRVDYWQVEGRDAVWKEKTIADLGSIEDFNQEYGLQFYSSDQLMLDSNDVKKIHAMKTDYISRKVNALSLEFEGYPIDYSRYMKFHPNFLNTTFKPHMEDLKSDNNVYVLSIDTADGVGRDYSVANLFKMKELPIDYLLRNKTIIKDPLDIFSLVQVATFRSNAVNIHTFADIIRRLVYDFLPTENLVVVLELNHKGEIIKDRIESHSRYYPGLLIHTKHKVDSQYYEPGIILNSFQKKKEYCDSFTYKLSINKILPNETHTVLELSSFGRVNNSSSFRAQSGNDDLAITSINVSPFFESPQYYEYGDILINRIRDKSYIRRLNSEIIEYNARELEQDTPFTEELMSEIKAIS